MTAGGGHRPQLTRIRIHPIYASGFQRPSRRLPFHKCSSVRFASASSRNG